VNFAFFQWLCCRLFLANFTVKHKGVPDHVDDRSARHKSKLGCRIMSIVRGCFKHSTFDKIAVTKCVLRVVPYSVINAVFADIQNRVERGGT
jgi:hypothetical protein